MYEGLDKLELPRQRHPRAKRVLKTGLALFIVLALVAGIGGFVLYRAANHAFSKHAQDYANIFPELPHRPFNVLVLGSDRRDVVSGSARTERQFKGGGGQRSDTIILVHVDPVSNHNAVLSFPRDLRVHIPGHGVQKINAAYSIGGVPLVAQVITQISGLQINHYIDINFSSFRDIVNKIGGISIYIDRPLIDKKSGLNIPQPGCIHMNGDTALSYVRARYIYANADLGRIQAQQRFLRALLAKAKSLSVLLDPGKILALSNAIGEGVQHDTHLTLPLARSIAHRLSGVGQQKIDFRTLPATGATIGGVSYLIPNTTADLAIFRAIKDNTVLPPFGKTSQSVPVPSDVFVKLLNATGHVGFAANQQTRLKALGYHVPLISSSGALSKTTIIYDPNSALKAQLIQSLYPYARVQAATKPIPTDIEVVFGSDALVPPVASPSAKASPTPVKVISPTC